MDKLDKLDLAVKLAEEAKDLAAANQVAARKARSIADDAVDAADRVYNAAHIAVEFANTVRSDAAVEIALAPFNVDKVREHLEFCTPDAHRVEGGDFGRLDYALDTYDNG